MAGHQGRGGNSTRGMNVTAEQLRLMLQERVLACDGKSSGDSCTFQNSRGESNGTCQMQNGTLSCRPSGTPQSTFNRSRQIPRT